MESIELQLPELELPQSIAALYTKAAHGLAAELFFVRNTAIPTQPNWQHNCGHTFPWRGVRGSVGGPTVKFLAAALALHVMSRAQLRELIVLFVVSSTLTLAVFFLALLLLPFETFTPFSFPRFPGFF